MRDKAPRFLAQMPPAQQAGILCNDTHFQYFAATRCGFPDTSFSPSAAAEYLREYCGIDSPRQMNEDTAARGRFDQLRTEFDAWTGRIARQRPTHSQLHRRHK